MIFPCTALVVDKVRGFAADRRGVSAIEFALIAPLMITLYLGGVEVTQAVALNRKATLVAHTVSDLVAQTSKVTDADRDDIFQAANAVAAPYPTANLQVTVSSVLIDNTGAAKVAWSDTQHGVARAVGSAVTLDPALAVPNTSLILGEVSYSYKPTFGWVLTGTLVLKDRTYMRPRITASVTRSAS